MGYFILGVIAAQSLLPLLDGLTTVILSGFEALKGYFGMKIAEYNNRIRKINLDDDSKNKKPIGFYCDTQEDEDDE